MGKSLIQLKIESKDHSVGEQADLIFLESNLTTFSLKCKALKMCVHFVSVWIFPKA